MMKKNSKLSSKCGMNVERRISPQGSRTMSAVTGYTSSESASHFSTRAYAV